MELKVIARLRGDFTEKFGVPRQSGLAKTLSRVVFEPEFRDPNALRGIEEYSHLWLLWRFDGVGGERGATVRPPRLGGNARVGVFATRSPFRPNPIGLSLVRLVKAEREGDLGVVLTVEGADMTDGTAIFDIKPYLPYADCATDASGGFGEALKGAKLKVEAPPAEAAKLPPDKLAALISALEQDPRPAYQDDGREYGMSYAGFEVKFAVKGGTLTVKAIEPAQRGGKVKLLTRAKRDHNSEL